MVCARASTTLFLFFFSLSLSVRRRYCYYYCIKTPIARTRVHRTIITCIVTIYGKGSARIRVLSSRRASIIVNESRTLFVCVTCRVSSISLWNAPRFVRPDVSHAQHTVPVPDVGARLGARTEPSQSCETHTIIFSIFIRLRHWWKATLCCMYICAKSTGETVWSRRVFEGVGAIQKIKNFNLFLYLKNDHVLEIRIRLN